MSGGGSIFYAHLLEDWCILAKLTWDISSLFIWGWKLKAVWESKNLTLAKNASAVILQILYYVTSSFFIWKY